MCVQPKISEYHFAAALWSRTPMVKCRMPLVLMVSLAETLDVASAASVMAHSIVSRVRRSRAVLKKCLTGGRPWQPARPWQPQPMRCRGDAGPGAGNLRYPSTSPARETNTMRFSVRFMRWVLGFLTALIGVLAVCGSAGAQNVRVGIVNSSTDVPFFIADAKGYFKEEGLSVVLPFDAGAKMIAFLGSGDLDVG